MQSSTRVHSCTVLVAKPDLDSRCIRRLDRCRVGLGWDGSDGLSPLMGVSTPMPPECADCGGSVCKRAGSLRGFSLGWLLRAVALYRGFAPVPPVGWTAEVLFASGQADCGGSVWFGSGGLSPLTGASPPDPRLGGLRRFSLQAGRQTAEVQFGSALTGCRDNPQPAKRAGFTPRSYFRSDIRKRS